MTKSKISIIIPAYNEEGNLIPVLEQVKEILPQLPQTEVIVVDDGSSDRTALEARSFPFTKIVQHDVNRGKGASLSTALKHASGEILVIQDADGEYSPHEIPKLVEPILEGRADFVYGSRFLGSATGMSALHRFGNRILSLAASLLYRRWMTDVMTGHKCLRRRTLELIGLCERGFTVEVEMTGAALKIGSRILELPITYKRRTRGYAKIGASDGAMCLIQLAKDFFKSRKSSGLDQSSSQTDRSIDRS